MSMKYIRENRGSFAVIKSSRNYGRFNSPDCAVFVRDLLVESNWDLASIGGIHEINDGYVALGVIDEKVHLLGRFKEKPSQKTVDNLYKKRLRNPNNSKYGLNITRVFDTFIIKKRIAGDDYIFGYYDKLEDAEFVRNFLLENSWNVNAFPQVLYDEETDAYKVSEVIDDKVYVLGSYVEDADIGEARAEFLNRIKKHKLGLANHEYLSELTGSIEELEERII